MDLEDQKTEGLSDSGLREYVARLQLETAYLRRDNGNLLHARNAFERLHLAACEDAAFQACRTREVARGMPTSGGGLTHQQTEELVSKLKWIFSGPEFGVCRRSDIDRMTMESVELLESAGYKVSDGYVVEMLREDYGRQKPTQS